MFWQFDKQQIDRIENMLVDIHNHVVQLQRENRKMALDLTALTEEVTRLETVEASAVTLLHTLVDEVAALKNDPVELQALVDRIKASGDDLAAAVAAVPAE
jgi:peptidoglycan hydrolase CwlO-like protein